MSLTLFACLRPQTIDKEKGVKKCATCSGNGVVVRTIRMGPMIQQMQQPCSACEGQGFSYDMKRTTEVLEVNVQKGAPDGHKASTHQRSTPPTTAASSLPRQTTHPPSPACLQIVFHNKADEIPDGDAGDVVFVLK